jgi:hypothetical protein
MNSESNETNQYQSILSYEEIYNDPYSRDEKFINAVIIEVQKTKASHILKIISEELPLEKFKVFYYIYYSLFLLFKSILLVRAS